MRPSMKTLRSEIQAEAEARGMTVAAYLEDTWAAHRVCHLTEERMWLTHRSSQKETLYCSEERA